MRPRKRIHTHTHKHRSPVNDHRSAITKHLRWNEFAAATNIDYSAITECVRVTLRSCQSEPNAFASYVDWLNPFGPFEIEYYRNVTTNVMCAVCILCVDTFGIYSVVVLVS